MPPSYFEVSLASAYKVKYLSDALDKCSISLRHFTSVLSLRDLKSAVTRFFSFKERTTTKFKINLKIIIWF